MSNGISVYGEGAYGVGFYGGDQTFTAAPIIPTDDVTCPSPVTTNIKDEVICFLKRFFGFKNVFAIADHSN